VHALATKSKREAAKTTPKDGPAMSPTAPLDRRVLRAGSCACGGGCPTCRAARIAVDAKLRLGAANDAHEREADRVAAQVTAMPETVVRMKTKGSAGAGVRAGAPATAAQSVSSDVVTSLGGGRPLERAARQYFEPRFGIDFGGVRVHTDGKAAASAESIGARAYTFGHHLVFGAGEYRLHSDEGRRLIAHELTHVVQHGSDAGTISRQEHPATCGADPCHYATSGTTAREIHLNLGMRAVRVYRRGPPTTIALEYTNLIVGPATSSLANANGWCHLYAVQGHQAVSGNGLINFVNYCGNFGFHSSFWHQSGGVERIPGSVSHGCARLPDASATDTARSRAFYDLVRDGDCVRIYSQSSCWRDPTFSGCDSRANCSP
jgi:hypothetical protein